MSNHAKSDYKVSLLTSRRALLKIAAFGGVAFASGLPGFSLAKSEARAAGQDFYFVQLSDLHWGLADPKANPDTKASLEHAIAAINAASPQPDFVVFTGDLTHMTKDPAERRKRMNEVKAMLGNLTTKKHVYLAGEHDAGADHGAAFQEVFGTLHQSFDHKGFHFIALDNASDPKGALGKTQLDWLATDLKAHDGETPLVVLAHRPLFDLKRDWDWFTPDSAEAIALLRPFRNVTVFYGHVHQEITHPDGNVLHISARSAMYPLPAPGSQPKKAPLPWDAAAKDHGIGWRQVQTSDPIRFDDHPTV